MLSLMHIGMPCKFLRDDQSGGLWVSEAQYPLREPRALSASKEVAMARASGFVSMTACKTGLTSFIRATYAFEKASVKMDFRKRTRCYTLTRSRLVKVPAARPDWRSSIVAYNRSGRGCPKATT